jgi:hypothetical protein
MSDTPRTKAATRMAFTSEHMVEIEAAQKMERELAAFTEANEKNPYLLRIRELERELADKRSQINRLIDVIKSRDTDKVYSDKICNELRDQRDALAEALQLFENCFDCYECTGTAEKALAATKGGASE